MIYIGFCCYGLGRLSADGDEFFKEYNEVFDTFDSMGLNENLLRGIYAYGNIWLPSTAPPLFSFSHSNFIRKIFFH